MNKRPKLILTIGLPASGKTTWAQEYQKEREKVAILSRDNYRKSIFSRPMGTKAQEKLITMMQTRDTSFLLGEGYDVIWADTNLREDTTSNALELASLCGADFETVDHFMDVPLTELILRDAGREAKVGPKVIDRMYQRYALPFYRNRKISRIDANTVTFFRKNAIIIDIDGTVAEKGDRNPFDYTLVENDNPRKHVVDIVKSYLKAKPNCAPIFLSGREATCYEETQNWLMNEFTMPFYLYMRAEGDRRKDSIVKEELFKYHVEPTYDVAFILDDRQQVVDMWRILGYECLQVQAGLF